jgi:hypothetical protein
MHNRLVVLLVSALIAPAAIAAPAMVPTIAYPFNEKTLQRDDLRQCASRLAALSGHGFRDEERAAFLILREDDTFECALWPASFAFRRASWAGQIPDRTIAVIHTHPRSTPDPSPHDYREARRLDIPVIVVAGERISMAR